MSKSLKESEKTQEILLNIKSSKVTSEDEHLKSGQEVDDQLLKENEIKVDIDEKLDKTKKQKTKKKKEKKLKKLQEDQFPKFKCPKPDHEESIVTHICLVPEWPERLLCKKCIENYKDEIGDNLKPFNEFFEEAQDTELVKDQKIEEYERFLKEREKFNKTLDLNYENIEKDLNDIIDTIRDSVNHKLQVIRDKIIEVKKAQYDDILKEAKEYEKKFDETYFDFEKKVDQLIIAAKDNYDQFQKVAHEIVEAPNFKERESIINFKNNIESKIRTLDDKFYLRRLKYVKNKIADDIHRLLDEVVNSSVQSSMISSFEWNPQSIELIKFTSGGAPVMALAEMEPGYIAAGYGFPEYGVEIWNTSTMQLEKSLRGHTKTVTNMIYLKNHKTLVTVSCDQYIKGWTIEASEPVWTIKAHQNFIFGLCKLSEDTFATGSHDKLIKVWKIGKNTPRNILHGHTEAVWCVIPLPDTEILASSSADGRIIIWDYESAESLRRIRAHKDQINQIIAYQDTKLISASDDCTIKMWDWKTGELERQLVNIQSPVWGILVAHDDNTLMCYGEQANVVIYDIETGSLVNVLYGFDQMVKVIMETSDHFIVTGSYDYKVRYWNSVRIDQNSVSN